MNIIFFLTPKNEVVYETMKATMRQVMERMEYHKYTAVPLIDEKGRYVGTITEGDLLWMMKNTPQLTFEDTSRISIKDVPRNTIVKSVSVDAHIADLISLAINQNYVPVVDDEEVFIGIIKRSDIINYCAAFILKDNK